MSGAEIVIKKLLDSKKYEFIIITARSEKEFNICVDKLTKIGLSKVKVFHSQNKKIDVLLNEKVDIIIDDDEKICQEASENKITALYFKNAATKTLTENEYLKNVNNWGEIYKYLILTEKK